MLRIWGRTNSINVQKVLWCCHELSLDYERIDAGSDFGVTDTPEYIAMNPNRLVPTIDDGDMRLWESNVIVRYLAQKHDYGYRNTVRRGAVDGLDGDRVLARTAPFVHRLDKSAAAATGRRCHFKGRKSLPVRSADTRCQALQPYLPCR
jgi:glutathione S-transferase